MSMNDIKGLSLACNWTFGIAPVQPEEARLLGLLERIGRTGSIASAAREAGISYRNAWGMLARWEANFGHPLLIPARGLGTRLTPFATRLLDLDTQIREMLAPQLAAAAEQMARGLAEAATPARAVPRIHASHDLALALLPARMAKQGQLVDLQFHGSLESLAAFAEGRCEIAGFHCPEGAVGATLWQQYKPYLRPRQQVLIRLAKRAQGIMVAPGPAPPGRHCPNAGAAPGRTPPGRGRPRPDSRRAGRGVRGRPRPCGSRAASRRPVGRRGAERRRRGRRTRGGSAAGRAGG